MPKYLYRFTEETTLYITIEAENSTEAGEIAEEMFCGGDIDWSAGKWNANYEFMREEKENV